MLRAIGGALAIFSAFLMPAVAEVPPDLAGKGPVAENVAADSGTVVTDHQVAAAEPTSGAAVETSDVAERSVRLGKAQFSPIGEAVLNLLRSQGGGHLRP